MLADELANFLRVIRDPRILVVEQDVELSEGLIDERLGPARALSRCRASVSRRTWVAGRR